MDLTPHVENLRTLNLRSGAGDIDVDRVTGHAGSDDVRLRALDRGAVVKNSNGDTSVGAAGGNGSIAVDVAESGVGAKSAEVEVRGRTSPGNVVIRRP